MEDIGRHLHINGALKLHNKRRTWRTLEDTCLSHSEFNYNKPRTARRWLTDAVERKITSYTERTTQVLKNIITGKMHIENLFILILTMFKVYFLRMPTCHYFNLDFPVLHICRNNTILKK